MDLNFKPDARQRIVDQIMREFNDEVDRANAPALEWYGKNRDRLSPEEDREFWRRLEEQWNR